MLPEPLIIIAKRESMKKVIYTWARFDEDSAKIAKWAKDKNFKSVYGIPRGGLVLATKLSHLLDIPLILAKDDITRDTLIVDDIVDTSATIKLFLALHGNKLQIATIFLNNMSGFKPNFFAREKEHWVIFPWETEETSRYDQTAPV